MVQEAKEPFIFSTRLHLSELTALRAYDLKELLANIKEVPGASIYHHTHRFLQQHQYLSPEPPNDFAYWISQALGLDDLAEMLASIDTIQYPSIRSLRDKIVSTIEEYIEENPKASKRSCPENDEFHFIKSISFVMPTHYVAHNINEFIDILGKITIDSIYFHIFEARLRLEKHTNDFANWIDTSVGNKPLADKLAKFDPYTFTMDDLRKEIIKIVKKGLGK